MSPHYGSNAVELRFQKIRKRQSKQLAALLIVKTIVLSTVFSVAADSCIFTSPTYWNIADFGRSSPTTGNKREATAVLATSDLSLSPISLGMALAQVPLVASETTQKRLGLLLVELLTGGRALYLVFDGIKAEGPSSVAYNVYINLPVSTIPRGPGDTHYAGAITFFGFARRGFNRPIVLNVTQALERLKNSGMLDNYVSLAIIPAGSPNAQAQASIQKVELIVR